MTRPTAYVLDASALLAVLNDEPGRADIEPMLGRATMSAVNWCEVAQHPVAPGLDVRWLRADLEELGLAITPFDAQLADQAALLWPDTREAGLSLADRACLALARQCDVPAVTTDRAWARIDVEVEVRLMR